MRLDGGRSVLATGNRAGQSRQCPQGADIDGAGKRALCILRLYAASDSNSRRQVVCDDGRDVDGLQLGAQRVVAASPAVRIFGGEAPRDRDRKPDRPAIIKPLPYGDVGDDGVANEILWRGIAASGRSRGGERRGVVRGRTGHDRHGTEREVAALGRPGRRRIIGEESGIAAGGGGARIGFSHRFGALLAKPEPGCKGRGCGQQAE